MYTIKIGKYTDNKIYINIYDDKRSIKTYRLLYKKNDNAKFYTIINNINVLTRTIVKYNEYSMNIYLIKLLDIYTDGNMNKLTLEGVKEETIYEIIKILESE